MLQSRLFLHKPATCFDLAQTIIKPLLKNFQNKAKCSAVIFTIWDYFKVCHPRCVCN